MSKRKKFSGFTLIELLVVIAIIAMLLAVLAPALKRAKEIAKRVICASRLHQVGVAMINYSQSFDYLPDALDINGNPEFGHGYALYRSDANFHYASGKLVPLRWAKLYEGGYMSVPEIFYCPGNRMGLYKYKSYTNPAPWGTLPQQFNTQDEYGNAHNQWVRMGYTYFPVPTGTPVWDGDRLETAKKFTQLNPSLPYATDIIQGRSSLSHQRSQDSSDVYNEANRYSVNALYSDAHVSNCKDPEVFQNQVWDQWNAGNATYDQYYFAIFKLIGSR